jgi:hypothetical protein
VVAARIVRPKLFIDLETDVLLDDGAAFELRAAHRSFSMRIASE